MTVDTRGRRAAQALVEAVERLGPVPDLDRLRRRRRRRVTTRAGLAVAAGIVAVALVGQTLPSPERLAGDPERPAGVPGLDGRVRGSVDVGRADGSELAAGTSGLWLISHRNDRGDELVRVDPGTDRVVARIAFGHSNSDPAVADDGSLYAVRPRGGSRPDRPELVRVDPLTNRIAATIALPPASPPYGATALVAAADAVWAAYPGGGLVRVDPASRRLRQVQADGRPLAVDHLAVARGWLWAAHGSRLHRIDPRDGTVTATIDDPGRRAAMPLTAMAGGSGRLWLHGSGPTGERLLGLDPVSGRIETSIDLGQRTGGRWATVVAGAGVVVVRSGSGLVLVDPAAGVVRGRVVFTRGSRGAGVAVSGGAVWADDPTRGQLLRVDPRP